MHVSKTECHKKACKDFILSDIEEGNSNISDENSLHYLCNSQSVGS